VLLRSSTVEVAASPPAIRLGPELAFQLHQAPDPGAVGADVGLDLSGGLADGGQVDAEQLRARLQRRRDRPAQVWVVPSPHRPGYRTHVRTGIENPAYRVSPCQPSWLGPGPGAILPTLYPPSLHRAARPRITLNAQSAWPPADQGKCDCGESRWMGLNESHPAENWKP
jgi:hypothetical protein